MSGWFGGIANLAGALSQGNDLQNEERVKSALQQAQITRQSQQDQIAEQVRARQAQSETYRDALLQAQTARTKHLDQAPQLGDPGYADALGAVKGAEQKATMPGQLLLEHDKIDYDREHGYHAPPPPAYESVPGTSPDGKPVNVPFDKRTGKYNTGGAVGGKVTGQGGALGEINHARLSAAGSQIANADDSMTQFEERVLSGQERLDATSLELAQKALSNGTGSALALDLLQRQNPGVAQYVRDASAAATAERMITPRGGSNATMNAEKVLMQGGAGGNPKLIKQARDYRKTLRHALSADADTPTTQPGQAPAGGTPASTDDVEEMLKQFEQEP